MSTATRIVLGFLVLLTAAFYVLIDKLTQRVERQYLEAAEEPMVDIAHVLASYLEQEFEGDKLTFEKLRRAFKGARRREFEARIYNLVKTSVHLNVYVTDAAGRVLFDSNHGLAEGQDYSQYHDVNRTLRGVYGARSTRTNEADERSSIMYVGAPIRNHGQIVGVLTVSKPQASMFGFISETRQRILFYGWTILLGTALAAILVAEGLFRPIRKLTDYARAVRRGERMPRPKRGSPDVRALGSALEEMRDALEDRKYVESYVQTLTHEMKSPVAAIRGAVELLQEPAMPDAQRARFLGNIRAETERLEDVIDRLLTLSVIESMKTLQHPVDIVLSDLIDELCAVHQHAFETRQIQLKRVFLGRPVVRGEKFLLEAALGNLLHNALDFSPVGGTVTIRVNQDHDRGQVEIVVEDDGPGVPAYALDRVFDRFYSLRHPATGRKSSGLGLCFVREAAALHGGTALLENRPGGKGARAMLTVKT